MGLCQSTEIEPKNRGGVFPGFFVERSGSVGAEKDADKAGFSSERLDLVSGFPCDTVVHRFDQTVEFRVVGTPEFDRVAGLERDADALVLRKLVQPVRAKRLSPVDSLENL